MAAEALMHSFEELVNLIGERELWVELHTGVKICLVDITDYKNKVFTGKYLPCVPQTKTYQIPYDRIQAVVEGGNPWKQNKKK
jgi:hypothetical protein